MTKCVSNERRRYLASAKRPPTWNQASYSDIARRLHGCAHGKFSEGRMLDAVWLQLLQGRMLDALRLQGASARRE